MSSGLKNEISSSEFEVDAQDIKLQTKQRLIKVLDNVRLALTALTLAAGITILGVSADSLSVYNNTQLPAEYFLPLWPEEFDVRPTNALIGGSVIIVVVNAIALLFSRVKTLRQRIGPHAIISVAAPAAGFIAAVVAMSLFYAVNTSSTVDTIQSWTCRWKDVSMSIQPHFSTLCKQSQAGLVLSVLLVPTEAFTLGLAGYQALLENQLRSTSHDGTPS